MNCNQSNKNTAICKLFDTLLAHYGPQKWWPCQTGLRWEIITGAILTQNTAWTNVEKAIGNLLSAGVMSPERVLATPDTELQELIRPAGFFTQKCAYLKAMAAFMLERESAFEQSADVWALRKELLSVKGVGRETADSILLYAFNKPSRFLSLMPTPGGWRSGICTLTELCITTFCKRFLWMLCRPMSPFTTNITP